MKTFIQTNMDSYLPKKLKISLMLGTKMTRQLVPASRIRVIIMWRIQLKSFVENSRWLIDVRICSEPNKDQTNGLYSPIDLLHNWWWTLKTYREENHRDCECDSSQDSQTDNQQENIILVDLRIGVEQLRFHMDCTGIQRSLQLGLVNYVKNIQPSIIWEEARELHQERPQVTCEPIW